MNDAVEENETKQEAIEKNPEKKMSVKQKSRLIITTILVLLLLSFIIQNWNKVKLDFLMFDFRVRIVTIILISAIFGSLITFLLLKHKAAKKKKEKR